MGTINEIITWLERRGVTASVGDKTTLVFEDRELALPTNHRKLRPSDVANWAIKQLAKPVEPATKPAPAPEPVPEAPALEPATADAVAEAIADAFAEEPAEDGLDSMTHAELNELLESQGLPQITGERKADKIERIRQA